jgi:hypothetical protein
VATAAAVGERRDLGVLASQPGVVALPDHLLV